METSTSVLLLAFLVLSVGVLVFLFNKKYWPFNGDSLVQGTSKKPQVQGCGVVTSSNQHVDPAGPGFTQLIEKLSKINPRGLVPLWNWDVSLGNKGLSSATADKLLFLPNKQCGGTFDPADDYPVAKTTENGIKIGELALGANEPDMDGYCMNGPNGTMPCSGTLFAQSSPLCSYCKALNPQCSGKSCIYEVTGCGMWPMDDCGDKNPTPWHCFGPQSDSTRCTDECKKKKVEQFKNFYIGLQQKGYSQASTPLLARNFEFVDELLEQAGCENASSEAGAKRLSLGCPTHLAFHHYAEGCPNAANLSDALKAFRTKIQVAKKTKAKFHLDNLILNELGVLKKKGEDSCATEDIATFLTECFKIVKEEGVFDQVTWFDQNKAGGTFDLSLVKGDQLSTLGQAYVAACQDWLTSART